MDNLLKLVVSGFGTSHGHRYLSKGLLQKASQSVAVLLTWFGSLWALYTACHQASIFVYALLAQYWKRSVRIEQRDEIYGALRRYLAKNGQEGVPASLMAVTTHLEAWENPSVERPEGQKHWMFSDHSIMKVVHEMPITSINSGIV